MGVEEGDKVQKCGQKNAIKHEKGDPLDFYDNPKYPPQNNFAKTPRTPLDFQLLCIYGYFLFIFT
jgi:hypothetical protein